MLRVYGRACKSRSSAIKSDIPYNGPGWNGETLTLPTIFDVGAQGQGLWTGFNFIEEGSDTEESVYFDFGSQVCH